LLLLLLVLLLLLLLLLLGNTHRRLRITFANGVGSLDIGQRIA